MQEDIVKLCPDCGSEFQMWVERCLDCGAALVVSVPRPEGFVPPRASGEEEPAIPPGCIHLRTATVGWIRRLSEDLDDAGIRHWITPPEWRRDPSLFVLPSDEEEVGRIDRARYAGEVPGITEEEALPQAGVRPRQRHPADDLDVKLCPRCGGEYQLWAETCADCGVALVRPWDLETALRKDPPAAPAIDVDSGACPACGARIQEGDTECPGCGLILAQPDVCPNCGEELEAYTASCRLCGQQLFETPTPERS